MKYINRLSAFAAVLSLLLISACGDDTPDPTTDPIPGQAISGTWFVEEPSDVTGPVADQFSDFIITITATSSEVNYTTNTEQINAEQIVFPKLGTFAVEESDNFTSGADVMRGPDNVSTEITLSEGGNVMTMVFTITGLNEENARVTEVAGEYVFRLQKQQQQQQ
ncbi:hypothetical protein [Catalinimonas niigatensis]|uniref:hypothetical protein n=1 Tax=Catalinimonas niigatensis TaxID=1397264 RepID=UPI0026668DA9|nr:hypothetical protein [Catalinimonas niigatensis]WPP48523.1 hypothetical protein PZB72_17785 [Catalinimonas niigatensis]